jgi:type II secretory pathway pseudopilin PulG
MGLRGEVMPIRMSQNVRKGHSYRSEAGLTLVELAVVVLLLAVFSTIVATRFNAFTAYRQNGEFRSFLNTWQFLLNEAAADGNSYRLIIDLDRSSYLIRQEIPLPPEDQAKVDLNKNLRLRSEKNRRKQIEDMQALTASEAFALIDEAEARRTLEENFALTAYVDPGRNVVLAEPVNFPALAEEQFFSGGVRIGSVTVDGVKVSQGRVALHFNPQGATNIAVVRFVIEDQTRIAVLNPLSGESKFLNSDADISFIQQGARGAPQ